MVSAETKTVENAQLVYIKWSLLSTKFNITVNIQTSVLHSKYLFMYGGKGLWSEDTAKAWNITLSKHKIKYMVTKCTSTLLLVLE
jgi:hypothetical protein